MQLISRAERQSTMTKTPISPRCASIVTTNISGRNTSPGKIRGSKITRLREISLSILTTAGGVDSDSWYELWVEQWLEDRAPLSRFMWHKIMSPRSCHCSTYARHSRQPCIRNIHWEAAAATMNRAQYLSCDGCELSMGWCFYPKLLGEPIGLRSGISTLALPE